MIARRIKQRPDRLAYALALKGGGGGMGSVPAIPSTLLLRDDQGSGTLNIAFASAVTSTPQPPQVGIPNTPMPVTQEGATLDGSLTYYVTTTIYFTNGQFYSFPEYTVVMDGANAIATVFPALPSPPVGVQYLIISRTLIPGDYSSDGNGAIIEYAITGSEEYPLTLTDTGTPPLGAFPTPPNSTVPWSIGSTGLAHSGSGNFGGLVTVAQPANGANDTTAPTTAWVNAAIAAAIAAIPK